MCNAKVAVNSTMHKSHECEECNSEWGTCDSCFVGACLNRTPVFVGDLRTVAYTSCSWHG